MTVKQSFLVEGIVSDMAKWLMEDRSVSLTDALGLIYNSQTFENYDILASELANGKIVQTEV